MSRHACHDHGSYFVSESGPHASIKINIATGMILKIISEVNIKSLCVCMCMCMCVRILKHACMCVYMCCCFSVAILSHLIITNSMMQ